MLLAIIVILATIVVLAVVALIILECDRSRTRWIE